VAAMGLWHLLGEPGKKKAISKKPETILMKLPKSGSDEPLKLASAKPKTPEPSILGNDGITMHFVPGGEVKTGITGPKNEKQTIQISPFYMDKKMVTNHHFADFLNEMKDKLKVENGIVKKNNEIWFYLGEGTESYEQIIYKHGRFHLRDTQYAAYPITRVTWNGALAYARHYGKQLLTESEWEYVVSKQMIPGKQPSREKADKHQISNGKASISSQMRTHMMDMGSSFDDSKNQVKTSAPKELGENFKEWVIQNDTGKKNLYGTGSKENISYPSLVVATSQYPGQKFKNFRYPWEAFADVGFRCAISLENAR